MGHIYRRNRIWWIKYHVNGEARYESSGSENKEDAKNLLRQRLGKPTQVKGALTVKQLLDDLYVYYKNNKRADYDASFKHLHEHFDGIKAARFTTAAADQYIQARLAAGCANNTINRELIVLRRAFSFAAESTPPKVGVVPKIRQLPPGKPRQGFLDVEGYKKVKAALPDWLTALFVVGYHTGARINELLNVRKDSIIGDRIILHTGETKTGVGRWLPIYGDMVQALADHLADLNERWPSCPWLFHHFGHKLNRSHSIWYQWKKAVTAAGYPDLIFHDLRRSAVRNMICAGVPEKVAMTVSGHKSRSMIWRYNIVTDQDVADVAAKVGGIFQSSAAGDNGSDKMALKALGS